MTRNNTTVTNMVGGEISPELYGHADIATYKKSVAKMENFIALPQGGGRFRPGTMFVNFTAGNNPGVLIPFTFSSIQAYVIEATPLKFRFFKNNGPILNAAKAITSFTQASPGVITIAAHGYSTGNTVFITGILAPTDYNGQYFIVQVIDANTFSLNDMFGNQVNSSDKLPWTSGGTCASVYEVATPYLAADLAGIQWAQSADTMYMVHPKYKPRKLTRTGDTAWTFATYTRTSDPFTNNTDGDGNCPAAVTFLDTSRLVFGGTINHPETLWFSASPSPNSLGFTQFDVFTLGQLATNGAAFTLSPVHGEVDSILWISNTALFLAVGTYGSVRILYGNSTAEAITPVAITAKSVTDIGCQAVPPVAVGTTLFYIQRNQRIVRSIDYDFLQNWYTTSNKNLASNHLTVPGFNQIVMQHGLPDVLWTLRQDGRFLGLTYDQKEDIQGWHRHYLGGQSTAVDGVITPAAKVLSLASIPRPTSNDQMWMIVQRVINGQTVNSVEYLSDWLDYPMEQDYYTGDPVNDQTWYQNAMYEVQKGANHLDMATFYDGTSANTLTLSIPGNGGVTYYGLAGSGVNGISNVWQWDSTGIVNSMPIGTAGAGKLSGLAVNTPANTVYSCQQLTGGTGLTIVSAPIIQTNPYVNTTVFANGITYGGFVLASTNGANTQPMVLSADGTALYVLVENTALTNYFVLKIATATGQVLATSAAIALALSDFTCLKLSMDGTALYFVNKAGVFTALEANNLTLINTQSLGTTNVTGATLSTDGTVFACIDPVNNKLVSVVTATWAVTTSNIPNANQPIQGSIDFIQGSNSIVAMVGAIANGGVQNNLNTFNLAAVLQNTYTLTLSSGLAADGVSPTVTWLRADPTTGFFFGVSEKASFNNGLFSFSIVNGVLSEAKYPLNITGVNAICRDSTNITLTAYPAGTPVVVTASANMFVPLHVQQQAWKKYLSDGSGGGRIVLRQYISATQMLGTVLSPPDTTLIWGANNWRLTATTISGLSYLNGTTVNVIADGGNYGQVAVQNGSITLNQPVSTCYVGYSYYGTIISLNLDPNISNAPAAYKPRNVHRFIVNTVNALGFYIGTTLYNDYKPNYRRGTDLNDRPPPPRTTSKLITFGDNHTREKRFVILQLEPLPCTINSVDIYMDTTDDF